MLAVSIAQIILCALSLGSDGSGWFSEYSLKDTTKPENIMYNLHSIGWKRSCYATCYVTYRSHYCDPCLYKQNTGALIVGGIRTFSTELVSAVLGFCIVVLCVIGLYFFRTESRKLFLLLFVISCFISLFSLVPLVQFYISAKSACPACVADTIYWCVGCAHVLSLICTLIIFNKLVEIEQIQQSIVSRGLLRTIF